MSRKEEIVKDLNYLCSHNSQISKKTSRKILESISWEWTENRCGNRDVPKGNGYYGCKYWSKSALKKVYEVEDVNETKGKIHSNDIRSIVTHEHVIPKNLFVTYIESLLNSGEEITQEFLEERLIACIVTKEEAKALDCKNFANVQKFMPEDLKDITFDKLNINDVWKRYEYLNKTAPKRPCEKCAKKCDKYEQCRKFESIEVYEIIWNWDNKKPVIKELTQIL